MRIQTRRAQNCDGLVPHTHVIYITKINTTYPSHNYVHERKMHASAQLAHVQKIKNTTFYSYCLASLQTCKILTTFV